MKNELIHYGVLGMKWGVRKAPERPRSNRKERKSEKQFEKIEKLADQIKTRESALARVNTINEIAKFSVDQITYGEKTVWKILDKMGENPALSYTEASKFVTRRNLVKQGIAITGGLSLGAVGMYYLSK